MSEETDETIREAFDSLLSNYYELLEKRTKYNGLMFDYVDGLSYLCHKIILKRGASYIDSPD